MEIGLDKFNIIVKINDLNHYNSNHYEILKPSTNIAKTLSTLSMDYNEHANNYTFYILNEKLKLIKIHHNFILEDKQILVLISKCIKYPINKFLNVENKVLLYLQNSFINKFLNTVKNSTYKNLNLVDFSLDGLPR